MSKFTEEGFRAWCQRAHGMYLDDIWGPLAAEYAATLVEAEQPAQPGEMTREHIDRVKALIDQMVEQSNDADTLDGANFTRNLVNVELDELWFRIRHDRAATEERVRAELERELDNLKFLFKASESDRAVLRTTIADLEKRLENTGVRLEDVLSSMIPWHKVNSTSVVIIAYDMAGQQVTQLARIERPTPAKLTPEQMAEAIVGHHLKTSPELGKTKGHDAVLADGWAKLARDLFSGKSIETLYAEIKGGE